MAVMSEAKHLSLSVTGEDEILRLSHAAVSTV